MKSAQGSLGKKPAFTIWPVFAASSVWPPGAALATNSVAGLALPPGRFSTTTG
jgi:hypothetical protein